MEEALSEIETLRCIFEDDIEVEDFSSFPEPSIRVRRKVRPNDEGDISSASIKVEIVLSTKYPDVSPAVILRKPRGLADKAVPEIEKIVGEKLEKNQGMPVVYEIFQTIASYIETNQHSDSLQCPICLCKLAGHPVSSTPCDHYAHTECLKIHTIHSQKQLGEVLDGTPHHMRHQVDKVLNCPVCRIVIDEDLEPIYPVKENFQKDKRRSKNSRTHLQSTPNEADVADNFEFDWKKWRKTQSELRKIFEKQKEKGGIIDLEEERKKNLITEDTVVVIPAQGDGQISQDGSTENASQFSHRLEGYTIRIPSSPGLTRNEFGVDQNSEKLNGEARAEHGRGCITKRYSRGNYCGNEIGNESGSRPSNKNRTASQKSRNNHNRDSKKTMIPSASNADQLDHGENASMSPNVISATRGRGRGRPHYRSPRVRDDMPFSESSQKSETEEDERRMKFGERRRRFGVRGSGRGRRLNQPCRSDVAANSMANDQPQ